MCVSDLTVSDVSKWLTQLPPHPPIHLVKLHVGVKSCPSGQITEKEWVQLISHCQRAFPRAQLRLSSILPARGRHNLNNTIVPSNRNLASVCRKLGAVFIDNDTVFKAQSGAPRLNLYSDATHPSAKGTAKLALNIMLANKRQLAGPTASSSPNNDDHFNPYQPVTPHSKRCRPPQLQQSERTLPGPPNAPQAHRNTPPPPSLHHFPPLISTRPSNPPPLLPHPPSADWSTTSRHHPVRHPGNLHVSDGYHHPPDYAGVVPSIPQPGPPRVFPRSDPSPVSRPGADHVYPGLVSSTSQPSPPRVMSAQPAADQLHPLAVHFLNMVAHVCAQQTAVY